jgi:glycerol kinase
MIRQASDSERLANSIRSNEGVYFVPAFVGLGAPYWDMYARGTILGMTRGTTPAHIVRAALESIAYQTRDVLECMEEDFGTGLKELRVDGGAAANEFLMQFQADILGVPVVIPDTTETTALGAAYLAGLAVGFWKDQEQIAANYRVKRKFIPRMSSIQRESLYRNWKRAVEKAKGWEQEEP